MEEVVERLLGPEAREGYALRKVARQEKVEAARTENTARAQAEARDNSTANGKLGSGALMAALGAAMLIAAIYLLARSLRINRRLNHYEFEHRTAGGVVEFTDFDAEQAHRRSRARAAMAVAGAFVLLLVGLGLLLGGGADVLDVLGA